MRRTVKPTIWSTPVLTRCIGMSYLGHSLQGMDVHYMAPSEEDLHRAMARDTEWSDGQLNLQSVDHSVDRTKKSDSD